jgi:hypothetical protein
VRDSMPAGAGVELLSRGQVRALKIAIVVMGVLIVAGLIVLIARVIYLASYPSRQAVPLPVIAPTIQLMLPAGAAVRNIALSGDRVALHYEAPGAPGIAVIDLTSGRLLSRVELASETPSGAR